MSGTRERVPVDRSGEPLLRMADIEKWYESVHALREVDFEVYPGEVVALVGDNGAGKSTLVEILTGVEAHNEGVIYWKGEPVEIDSVQAARDLKIETVYQDQAVVEERSVAENIFMGREPTRSIGPFEFLDRRTMFEEAEKITRRLGLDIASPEQEVRFCSGGEKQGVAIARAMYFDAELVILDEPTTALAVSGINRVLDFVEQLQASGTACVFITHNLHHAHQVADRFVVLSQGEKVADVTRPETSIDELERLQLANQPQAEVSADAQA